MSRPFCVLFQSPNERFVIQHQHNQKENMLIEVLSSLFDGIGLNSNQRKHATRALIRTFCKLTTYRQEVDAYLRQQIGRDEESKQKERQVFKFWQSQRCNYEMVVMFWRGIHCYVETQNTEYAEMISGINQRDIRYAYTNLTRSDVMEIKASGLNWRRPPITQLRISKMLDALASTIGYYAHKLQFVEYCEGSVTKEDLLGMLKLEALSLIIHYEYERNRKHLKNTVIRGLKSAWSELASYYKCSKRDSMPSRKIVDPKTGKVTHDYESIRETLTVKSSDGDGEIENPALLSRSVRIDKELEVASLVKLMLRRVPRYGRYLKLCVFTDRRDPKFNKYLKLNNIETKTSAKFHAAARNYCGITARDKERALRIASRELGVPVPV